MSAKNKIFIFLLLIFFIVSCRSTRSNTFRDKSLSYRAALETKQFFFTFPVDSFAFVHREELIKECENALNHDLKILKMDSFPELIRVHYYNSRADLWKYMNMTPSGTAEVWKNTLYLVRNKESKAPTKHEMMHLLAGKLFGFPPPPTSYWMNEGLATYAANTCNGFNVEQIYSYFLDKHMLISMDSLSNSFYKYDEMIAYHQSAYVIQWLLEHYEFDKLKKLWQSGFGDFENIYGIPYRKVESDIEVYLRGKYPTPTDINWDSFKKGCGAKK